MEDTRTSCPACSVVRPLDFFEHRRAPVDVGTVFATERAAQAAPTGDIRLAWCPGCGFVFNRSFDASLVSFRPGYEIALHHSASFRAFVTGLADSLIERFHLRNKELVEIGCGDGYFLRRLCERGPNRGLGIDPATPREGREAAGSGEVELVREFYSDKQAHPSADFVCCLSVFEDIPQPAELLPALAGNLGGRRVPVYFEVFNACRAFERQEVWSVHYEQCNYFGRESLVGLFERCGFRVLKAGPCFAGDQYLFVEALSPGVGRRPSPEVPSHSASAQLPPVLSAFRARHKQQVSHWNERLRELSAAGQRVVLWGSGGKGVTFLNTLDSRPLIRYVVDVNPNRQGKFVPVAGQAIVPPRFLLDYRPDTVIISNPLYEGEIRRQAGELGLVCEFLRA
jgi:hypothetical protein